MSVLAFMTLKTWIDVGTPVGLLVVLYAARGIGNWIGFRQKPSEADSQLATVQGATLALLGLLLGFAFAGAAGRFIERQDIIVQEANAIGTAYLRTQLLGAPYGGVLRKELRTYADDRLALFRELDLDQAKKIMERIEADHARIWEAARTSVLHEPATMLLVLPPVNDLIDMFAVRNAATVRHLPITVLALLIVAAAISLATIGYGRGLERKRSSWSSGALSFLIATSLWVTIDLDYPRLGLIRINDAPLVAVQKSMTHPADGTSAK